MSAVSSSSSDKRMDKRIFLAYCEKSVANQLIGVTEGHEDAIPGTRGLDNPAHPSS